MPQNWISPRVRAVLSLVNALTCPPALLVAANSALEAQVSNWLLVPACILSVPLSIAARIWWNILVDKINAKRLGAQFPPRLSGKWIGDIDLLLTLQKVFKNGYFGDKLSEPFDGVGNIYEIYILGERTVFTCNPDYIKQILAADFSNFVKGPLFNEHLGSILGGGIFNSDGERWKFHRAMTRPFFSRDRISDFDLFDKHIELSISKMKDRLAEGYAVDFQDIISRFTLDTASEFLFGSCLHTLASQLPYPHFMESSSVAESDRSQATDFSKAFVDAQMAVACRTRRGRMWAYFELFKDETKEPMKIVNAYLEPILKEILKRSANKEDEEKLQQHEVGSDETLLEYLVRQTKDPVALRDETLNVLIAGRDSIAATLTFVIYFLCMHPHVLERLRKEILDTVGPTERPSYDNIKEMKYLRAVINETLRLYPAVPINVRTNVNPVVWPNPDPNGKPFYIPAGTPFKYSVYMMHRRKEYWGPDAEEFDPDRFIDERLQKYLIPNPFIFLPFNAGPRICLGQQYAYNETSFFLIRLLQNFSSMSLHSVSQPPESRPPAEWRCEANKGLRKGMEEFFPKLHLTMYSLGGLWVKMSEKQEV